MEQKKKKTLQKTSENLPDTLPPEHVSNPFFPVQAAASLLRDVAARGQPSGMRIIQKVTLEVSVGGNASSASTVWDLG